MRTRRGEIATIALLALGLGTLFVLVAKPAWADKRSRQANDSKDASAQVEAAVAKAVEGEQKKAAQVSASVKMMGQAAAEAGNAPWAIFVAREANHIAPLLPPPDYKALYAAEARKRAVLEGKLELADKLYREDAKDKQRLLDDNAKLRAKVADSFRERREMDNELAETAAYARGVESQRNLFIIVRGRSVRYHIGCEPGVIRGRRWR